MSSESAADPTTVADQPLQIVTESLETPPAINNGKASTKKKKKKKRSKKSSVFTAVPDAEGEEAHSGDTSTPSDSIPPTPISPGDPEQDPAFPILSLTMDEKPEQTEQPLSTPPPEAASKSEPVGGDGPEPASDNQSQVDGALDSKLETLASTPLVLTDLTPTMDDDKIAVEESQEIPVTEPLKVEDKPPTESKTPEKDDDNTVVDVKENTPSINLKAEAESTGPEEPIAKEKILENEVSSTPDGTPEKSATEPEASDVKVSDDNSPPLSTEPTAAEALQTPEADPAKPEATDSKPEELGSQEVTEPESHLTGTDTTVNAGAGEEPAIPEERLGSDLVDVPKEDVKEETLHETKVAASEDEAQNEDPKSTESESVPDTVDKETSVPEVKSTETQNEDPKPTESESVSITADEDTTASEVKPNEIPEASEPKSESIPEVSPIDETKSESIASTDMKPSEADKPANNEPEAVIEPKESGAIEAEDKKEPETETEKLGESTPPEGKITEVSSEKTDVEQSSEPQEEKDEDHLAAIRPGEYTSDGANDDPVLSETVEPVKEEQSIEDTSAIVESLEKEPIEDNHVVESAEPEVSGEPDSEIGGDESTIEDVAGKDDTTPEPASTTDIAIEPKPADEAILKEELKEAVGAEPEVATLEEETKPMENVTLPEPGASENKGTSIAQVEEEPKLSVKSEETPAENTTEEELSKSDASNESPGIIQEPALPQEKGKITLDVQDAVTGVEKVDEETTIISSVEESAKEEETLSSLTEEPKVSEDTREAGKDEPKTTEPTNKPADAPKVEENEGKLPEAHSLEEPIVAAEETTVPILIVEKTAENQPSHGEDLGPDATTGQKEAFEARAEDAEPDQTIVLDSEPHIIPNALDSAIVEEQPAVQSDEPELKEESAVQSDQPEPVIAKEEHGVQPGESEPPAVTDEAVKPDEPESDSVKKESATQSDEPEPVTKDETVVEDVVGQEPENEPEIVQKDESGEKSNDSELVTRGDEDSNDVVEETSKDEAVTSQDTKIADETQAEEDLQEAKATEEVDDDVILVSHEDAKPEDVEKAEEAVLHPTTDKEQSGEQTSVNITPPVEPMGPAEDKTDAPEQAEENSVESTEGAVEVSEDHSQEFSVKPLPASESSGNPIDIAPGEPIPDLGAASVDSNVKLDEESYEKADASNLGVKSEPEAEEFSVNPLPASETPGNPIELQPGEPVPETGAAEIVSSVKLDQDSYEQSDASNLGVKPETSEELKVQETQPDSEASEDVIVVQPTESALEDHDAAPDSNANIDLEKADAPNDVSKAEGLPSETGEFSVSPLPASETPGNPIDLQPGESIPKDELSAEASNPDVKLDEESYEKADASNLGVGSVPEGQFSVSPLPASETVGNPIELEPGEPIPKDEVCTEVTNENVKLDEQSYENADASNLGVHLDSTAVAGIAAAATVLAGVASTLDSTKEEAAVSEEIQKSSTPIPEVAETAAEVADSAAKLDVHVDEDTNEPKEEKLILEADIPLDIPVEPKAEEEGLDSAPPEAAPTQEQTLPTPKEEPPIAADSEKEVGESKSKALDGDLADQKPEPTYAEAVNHKSLADDIIGRSLKSSPEETTIEVPRSVETSSDIPEVKHEDKNGGNSADEHAQSIVESSSQTSPPTLPTLDPSSPAPESPQREKASSDTLSKVTEMVDESTANKKAGEEIITEPAPQDAPSPVHGLIVPEEKASEVAQDASSSTAPAIVVSSPPASPTTGKSAGAQRTVEIVEPTPEETTSEGIRKRKGALGIDDSSRPATSGSDIVSSKHHKNVMNTFWNALFYGWFGGFGRFFGGIFSKGKKGTA